MTLPELNTVDRDRFVAALGWIFEQSPWVAERAWARRPFADLNQLHAEMIAVVAAAPPEEQLALLRAHPDLGSRLRMSEASVGEQAGAGLNRLTPDEFETLQRQTAAYRRKFGFPFLLAVKACTQHDVLEALARRLPHGIETERPEALRQVARIAEFRLRDTLGGHAST
ncbi:MAG: 2-oxo-4-hydroxy-4-carboxy-5-ureidoimidazoline decarboxylase [Acidobacteriota bacterium]